MADPMDVDSDTSRGTKRKADDLSVVTAPRRIKVGQSFTLFLNLTCLGS